MTFVLISKINTADNVFGIFTSRAMKERGKYQIQCMKSRSSTGVGQKIDLEYNIETMRITDEAATTKTTSVVDQSPASWIQSRPRVRSNPQKKVKPVARHGSEHNLEKALI